MVRRKPSPLSLVGGQRIEILFQCFERTIATSDDFGKQLVAVYGVVTSAGVFRAVPIMGARDNRDGVCSADCIQTAL
jgi:hypothetical protein